MANEKKLVIKINCQAPKQNSDPQASQLKMVTEWNVKRIILALFIILTIVAGLFFFFMGNDTPADSKEKSTNSAAKTETISAAIDKPVIIENDNSALSPAPEVNKPVDKFQQSEQQQEEPKLTQKENNPEQEITAAESIETEPVKAKLPAGLTRAQLSNAINNKEPVGDVKLPIRVHKKYATGVYYFTELKGMKGKKVFHEWHNNGQLVFKRRINILGNRWRAHTRKMLQYKSIGDWEVRLIKPDGEIIHSIKFSVTR